MENLKEKIHSEFQTIDFESWKIAAQSTLKNNDIDSLLTKKLSSKITIKSIYDRSQVTKAFDLSFTEKSPKNKIYSLDNWIDLPCESDLEVAVLVYLIKNSEKNEQINVRIDPNFFLSIAKFRAIRYILSDLRREDIVIIANSSLYNKSYSDVENNLIRLTTEAMSAIIGGADKVNLLPYNYLRQNDEFGKRITDNILLLLNEESYLSNVKDPLFGSYLIENLTAEFVNSVNEINEEISNLDSENKIKELILKKCNDYKEQQLSLLNSQKKKIIGVNIYQNKKDSLAEIEINSTSNIAEFESRKSAIDNINPKVYLANFTEKNTNQDSLLMALNTYNIPFQVSSQFELVEDAFNAIKLFDPDLVIVNGNSDIERILKNMLTDYNIANITEFDNSSILNNIDTVIIKLEVGV